MCYDAAQLANRILEDAKRIGAPQEEIERLEEEWLRLSEGHTIYYHINAFEHPELLVFNKIESKLKMELNTWGLIPEWTKNAETAKSIQNKTILARGETMFDKPSFKDASLNKRCIIPLTGFFEHFHKKGKTYPYYIRSENDSSLLIGGIQSSWFDTETQTFKNTMSIVTQKGNEFMKRIHNNPKIAEARMPLILQDEEISQWLQGGKEDIMELINREQTTDLKAKTVNRLKGKKYIGNRVEIQEQHDYPELIEPPSLFD